MTRQNAPPLFSKTVKGYNIMICLLGRHVFRSNKKLKCNNAIHLLTEDYPNTYRMCSFDDKGK
ncbi:MAG: hypothetical protein ACPL3A_05160 [Thermoanaerobacteraceae bacterium]